jgi:hypothetical protein
MPGGVLGGMQAQSYLSGDNAVHEGAWWESVGALCN